MVKLLRTFTTLAIAVLVTSVAAPALADLASSFGVYVYPTQSQTASQQAAAESQCYSSAQTRTGVNPMAPPPTPGPAPTTRGGLFRGGARGAGAGAAIGAVAGNAGEGAAIGAIAGGLFGRRRQKLENEQAAQGAQIYTAAEYQGAMNNFRTAFSACMNAKGYVAR